MTYVCYCLAFLETAIVFKATVAFKAFLKTSALVIAFALSFICLVCSILVILLILIKVIVQDKSSGKELL
jgi:hypothetical protein